MTALPSALCRQTPVQTRGEQRVKAIVTAAAEVLLETGFDALTLTEVASRSGSAIGSLYRFFSNKEQLIEALEARVTVSISAQIASNPPVLVQGDSLENFVERYVKMIDDAVTLEPCLPYLLGNIRPHCRGITELAATPLKAFLDTRAPHQSSMEQALCIGLALETSCAAVKLISRVPGATQRDAMLQLKDALAGYLERKIKS